MAITHNKQTKSIKKATGGKKFVPRPGAWQIAKVEDMRGKSKAPKTGRQLTEGLSEEAKLEMARDKASGMTDVELSDKYIVSRKYVAEALKDLYINNDEAKRILKGLYFGNAIACAKHTQSKIKEMSPMQSAVASKIFLQGGMDLEKHDAAMPKEPDMDLLSEVGKALKGLRELTEDADVE